MIERGGKVPQVLSEITRELERFELVFNDRPENFGYYTFYSTLAEGNFSREQSQEFEGATLEGYVVMRSALIKQRFAEFIYPDREPEDKLDQAAPVFRSAPTVMPDTIQLYFSVRSRGFEDLDLGWVVPDTTIPQLQITEILTKNLSVEEEKARTPVSIIDFCNERGRAVSL